MELSKKTTILLSPELHARLTDLAARRKTSMGRLIREACEETFGERAIARRVAAAEAMARLNLPVGTVEQMKRESVPDPKDLPS